MKNKKNILKAISSLIMLFLILYSCSSNSTNDEEETLPPESNITIPELIVNDASNIEVRTANINAKLVNNGNASVIKRGICINTTGMPTIDDGAIYLPTSSKASGEFTVTLTELEPNTSYYVRSYATNSKGTGYSEQVKFTTKVANTVNLKLGDVSVSGAHDIFVDVYFKNKGDYNILESGVVWSINPEPTINDNKVIDKMSDFGYKFKQRITGLNEETSYYIKPYAKTEKGVNYGPQVILNTIKKGSFTYSFNKNGADEATVKRIKDAFDSATEYYNNFTSIIKHVTVNYSPGTPTADANFDGWIRVGSNSAYQKTGTAMHEMNHTVGGGTHWKWNELFKDGKWQGKRANEIMSMMTDSVETEVKQAGVHSWGYGINGAHEDTGEEMLYIIHALLRQGMKSDGLPSN